MATSAPAQRSCVANRSRRMILSPACLCTASASQRGFVSRSNWRSEHRPEGHIASGSPIEGSLPARSDVTTLKTKPVLPPGVYRMALKTKRWDDPIEVDDGTRILICRYRPRGVRKENEAWSEWLPDLAP